MRQRERRLLADVLVGAGAAEAMTVPLIAATDLERFGLTTDGTVEATNALRAEEPFLRPAILPGLLKAGGVQCRSGTCWISRSSSSVTCSPRRPASSCSRTSATTSRCC